MVAARREHLLIVCRTEVEFAVVEQDPVTKAPLRPAHDVFDHARIVVLVERYSRHAVGNRRVTS